MAQTDVNQTTEIPKKEEPDFYYEPEYSTWMDDEKIFKVEVELPGVKRENIKIKALRDSFELNAICGAIGYTMELEFGFDFDPAKIQSHYEEGLLTLTFTIVDPMDNALDVKID